MLTSRRLNDDCVVGTKGLRETVTCDKFFPSFSLLRVNTGRSYYNITVVRLFL